MYRFKNRIRQLRDRKTAEDKLNPALGFIQQTEGKEKSHYTWWIPIGVEPWHDFRVISE